MHWHCSPASGQELSCAFEKSLALKHVISGIPLLVSRTVRDTIASAGNGAGVHSMCGVVTGTPFFVRYSYLALPQRRPPTIVALRSLALPEPAGGLGAKFLPKILMTRPGDCASTRVISGAA